MQLILCCLRNNIAQDVLAEFYGCFAGTVSRTNARLCPIVTTVLKGQTEHVAARELQPDSGTAKTGHCPQQCVTSTAASTPGMLASNAPSST